MQVDDVLRTMELMLYLPITALSDTEYMIGDSPIV